ncbi:MAG: peptidase domain-containing ABC transporter [Bacteroidota bacterium]|nr:peptidase domain-containing ABC transporter [Bacteroidota bacterium]
MLHFPFDQQYDSMDCGPACLKMVAAYYGKSFTLDRFRQRCNISREGVSLLGISKAAEEVGFRSLGGKFTFEQLAEKAPLPCIIHWQQNHFVIVYRIKKRRGKITVYVADPGKGLLTYTEQEFCDGWISTRSRGEEKGVALLLEPTALFYQQEGETVARSRFRFLGNYFLPYRKLFGQLLLGLLLGSVLQLFFPFLTQAVVDMGIANQNVGFIYLILFAQLMLLLGRTAVDFIRRWILLHISARINISLISDFFIKLMRLPMSFFDTKLLGDLLQRIEDHNRIERFLTAQSLNLLFSIFSLIIFSLVLLVYDLRIFLVFISGTALYALWIIFFLKRRRILDYRYFEQQAINRSKTYQLINGMQEIKLQGCEQRKRWEWEDVQADLFKVNLSTLSLQQTQEAGGICINELKNIAITIMAATAVIHGQLTLGMMLSVQYIIGQLNGPVEQMINFIYQWQDVSISLERINEIHIKQDEEAVNQGNILPLNGGEDIRIDNLSFQYEGPYSPKALNNVSLLLPKGKVTAIVGASGSGKTTLIKLLLGYYSPTEGNIEVDGKKMNDLDIRWWRHQCGVVMQDGFIFSESIARNIAANNEEIDTDRLLQAVTIANIRDHIEKLPLGYNTIIGQEGQGLSQGQKQRILIARAVYRNPQFIFLDEATNALDANNERTIIENLDDFYKGRTVVIVAHRLSTVKNADQIVVLDKGEIVEIGNHQQLAEKRGAYYQLVKNQLELGT